MTITVEFYGIPRERAGVATTVVDGRRLGEILIDLAQRFPRLGESCFDSGRLRPAAIANVNGGRFVSDPSTLLEPGDTLLILTADAGG